MFFRRMKKWHRCLAFAGAIVLGGAATSRAGDNQDELRQVIQQQGAQIDALQRKLEMLENRQAPAEGRPDVIPAADPAAAPKMDDTAVKKIVGDYLKDNPGAGMPSGVQTGFYSGQGFVIRSAPEPNYVKWDDDCKIPFELRFRGRIQLDYYRYKVTDRTNHITNLSSVANANADRQNDFSQLEVKRLRLVFQGTVFDPNLRYHFELDGNTRGLGGTLNNKVIQSSVSGGFDPNTSGVNTVGGGVTVDHAVRVFQAFVAYDFHGCCAEKGCGPDCPPDRPKYAPTFTLIAGKSKPLFGLEEYMGSANEQFVEFSMADWFFDADDDNLLMMAGTQIKAFDDRLYVMAVVTNGNESQFPNTQMDDYPGFNGGFWWDFGGTWNEDKRKWDLYGDCLSDIDYSCNPVVRVGGAVDLVPMDRRSLYGDLEQSRVLTMPAGPGGTFLINTLNGDLTASPTTATGGAATGSPLNTAGSHAVDKLDSYSFDAFISGKWHGFSLTNEWWLRDLTDWATTPNGRDLIIYQHNVTPTTTANALFPNRAIIDYGQQLQGGYFVIPKKLEMVARWSWIRGQSGDINGNGTFVRLPSVPGVVSQTTGAPVPVDIVNGAFRQFHEANEYTVGVNYYFKRQLLKWQTDIGWYDGGNPARNGTSAAGDIAGLDGWLLRTQFQLAF